MIITIDGNIGSGKSTLVDYLKRHLKNVVFLQDPVHLWEEIKDENGMSMVEKFYQNQEKYSFSFQIMAFISRLAILRKAVRENPEAVIISERSLFTDRHVFAKMLSDQKKIESVNFKIYLNWFDEFAKDFPVHKYIYIECKPEICQERIKKRSRTGEETIPLDYLI
jgi:deoxycitidine kinase/deoxyguanosine kinase